MIIPDEIKLFWESFPARNSFSIDFDKIPDFIKEGECLTKEGREREAGFYWAGMGSSLLAFDPAMAFVYFEKSLEIFKKINDFRFECISAFFCGVALNIIGEFDQAISFFSLPINFLEKQPELCSYNTQILADSFFYLGKIYRKKHKFPESNKYLQKCLKLTLIEDDVFRSVDCFIFSARNQFDLGDKEAALDLVCQGIKLIENFQTPGAKLYMAACFETLGDINIGSSQASGYFQKALDIYFRLYGDNSSSKVKSIEAKIKG